jgi:hypothetical protein
VAPVVACEFAVSDIYRRAWAVKSAVGGGIFRARLSSELGGKPINKALRCRQKAAHFRCSVEQIAFTGVLPGSWN